MRCLILVSLATLIAGCGIWFDGDDYRDDTDVVRSYICMMTDRSAWYTVYRDKDPCFHPRKYFSPQQDLTKDPQVCHEFAPGIYKIVFDPISGYLVPNPIEPINLKPGETKPITVGIAALVPK